MKKLFVLLVLVVAMVGAPLFAEITEDGWAGDFTYKIGGNFQNASVDSVDNDMDLSMSASIGEFTTFSVGIEADPFAFSGSELIYDDNGDGVYDESTDLQTTGIQGVVKFNKIEMTQDFSSFIGNDITLKMTVGQWKHELQEYEVIGEIDQTDGAEDNALMLTLGAAGVTVYAWASPTSAFNPSKAGLFTLEAVYESDMVSGNIAFMNKGTAKGIVAGGAEVVVSDLTVAMMFNSDLDTEVTELNVGAGYSMAPLTVEVEFESEDINETDTSNTYIVGGVGYAVTDMVTLKAGATYYLTEDVDMGFDGGVCLDVDGVAWTIGASYKGSSYVAPYKATELGTEDFAVSLKMDVDF